MKKPILCLDFDGVIHSYTSKWAGADKVLDPPVPGSIAFLRNAVKHFEVHIFSSRSNAKGGREAMAAWLGYHALNERLSDHENLAWISAIKWPTEKPPALVTIDDRALTFSGQWSDYPIDRLLRFRPWNKR